MRRFDHAGYTEALGGALAPDANATLRITCTQVMAGLELRQQLIHQVQRVVQG